MPFLEKNANSKLLRYNSECIIKSAALEAFFKVRESDMIVYVNPSHLRIRIRQAEMANPKSPYNVLLRAGLVVMHKVDAEYTELSCVDKEFTNVQERIDTVT